MVACASLGSRVVVAVLAHERGVALGAGACVVSDESEEIETAVGVDELQKRLAEGCHFVTRTLCHCIDDELRSTADQGARHTAQDAEWLAASVAGVRRPQMGVAAAQTASLTIESTTPNGSPTGARLRRGQHRVAALAACR